MVIKHKRVKVGEDFASDMRPKEYTKLITMIRVIKDFTIQTFIRIAKYVLLRIILTGKTSITHFYLTVTRLEQGASCYKAVNSPISSKKCTISISKLLFFDILLCCKLHEITVWNNSLKMYIRTITNIQRIETVTVKQVTVSSINPCETYCDGQITEI
ncbi:hypothetical protein BDF20DRAFT_830857 [Mycotypha africana]|uniref:uncharacterized protein n=1 Tax=Mycotypha africana TaxID=64632 RepID=UPI0023012C15|nr:uncharacterized protein BDF20DRAFT_830857 [Mycotypha africana]KAI8990751.1 hypothetical protein BDF20DRAFT_830857 [Mycotypha africana]